MKTLNYSLFPTNLLIGSILNRGYKYFFNPRSQLRVWEGSLFRLSSLLLNKRIILCLEQVMTVLEQGMDCFP
jgi:hypothetical protein